MTDPDPDRNGWCRSAPAWIARMENGGDFSRRHVLDRPLLAQVRTAPAERALDVGCGEGRFCRLLSEVGITATGLDPVPEMIRAARRRDPSGSYVQGFAEALPFTDAAFDLVISYLSLIDIDDPDAAIAEMARVLAPGGRLLVGHLNGFATSSAIAGKRRCAETGKVLRPLGRYLDEDAAWFEWDGLRIRNWHRPLSRYMAAFLGAGLTLTAFEEPRPTGGPPDRVQAYADMPYLMLMAWRKPDAPT
ncbi:MAG: methyltransferase domain-containing protein [Pseudomonadota bacterium]